MKEIIHALKYERRRSIAPPLGELMRNTRRASPGGCGRRRSGAAASAPRISAWIQSGRRSRAAAGAAGGTALEAHRLHAIADRTAEGSAAGECEGCVCAFGSRFPAPGSRLGCAGRRRRHDRSDARGLRDRAETNRGERSASAYSCPSGERTARSGCSWTLLAVNLRRASASRRVAHSDLAKPATCSTAPTKRPSIATHFSGLTSRRGRDSPPRPPIARISRGCATCRATSTSRSSTCAPAWRAATRCRACRCSDAIRPSSPTSRATPAIRSTRRSPRCRRASRQPIRTRFAPKPPPSFATSSLPHTRGC